MPPDSLFIICVAGLLLALSARCLPPSLRLRGALLGAFVATIATTTALVQNGQPPAELDVAERPIADPSDGYVGSSTCRSCHAHEHDTWDASYHQSMTQVATPETVLGDFDDYEITIKGKHYKLSQDEEGFWVEGKLEDEFGPGEDSLSVKRRIVLTTGSHHMQVYWFESTYTRVLGQLPLSWQIEERRWLSRDASFVLPSDDQHSLQFSAWNFVCVKCHATQGRPKMVVEGGQVREADTRVTDFGIACESCHGPGGEHVAANQSPLRRYAQRMSGKGDPTIVNPATIDPKLSTQICGQCHAVWDYLLDRPQDKQRRANWFKNGFLYRPGGDVEKNRNPEFENKNGDTGFWSDGLIRTAGREYNALHGSPCYEKGGMSCLSCHQMHQPSDEQRPKMEWANDQLKLGDDNQSCLSCHESFGKDVAAHSHHAVGSAGSSCVNCHMPHTTYGLMKGVRTHRIASPSVEVTLRTGRPNACNQCHLDKPLAWTATRLSDWYGIKMPKLNRADQRAAAGVRGVLEGDAGQRALYAWSLGWEPAQSVSGKDWLVPYLAELLVDPYPAVRIIAERSLRTLPGFEEFRHDLDGSVELRQAAKEMALSAWSAQGGAASAAASNAARPEILIKVDGSLDIAEFRRMLKRRNNTKIRLVE